MGSLFGSSGNEVTFSGTPAEKAAEAEVAKQAEATSLETRVKKEDEEGRRRRAGRSATILTGSSGSRPSGASTLSRQTLGI